MRTLSLGYIVLFGLAAPAAQDRESDAIAGPDPIPEGPFVIAAIDFEVDGPSPAHPLLLVSGLTEGTVVADAAVLEETLARARQDLLNRRVFDGIVVEWAIVETPTETGDPTPVEVLFVIDDGWTLLPIPFYRYNSNSGHNPFVVLYWDNIFGTLPDFGMSAGYYSRNWTTPFAWDVRLDWRRVRMLGRNWNFSFDQEFETVEQATPRGDVEFAYTGYSTRFGMSTSFQLTDWLRYSISPNVGFDYAYETVTNTIGEALPADRAAVGFSHSLGTGQVDWIENLRRGWGASVSNSVSYDPEKRDWQADIGASAERHWLPLPWASPAVRVRANHNLGGNLLSRGGVVRGVPNNRVFGQTLVAINAQTSIRAVNWRRVTDIQVVPFVDVAAARKEATPLTWDDMAVGLGTDVVVFPDFIRGFEARISVGVDGRDLFFGDGGAVGFEFYLTESLQF